LALFLKTNVMVIFPQKWIYVFSKFMENIFKYIIRWLPWCMCKVFYAFIRRYIEMLPTYCLYEPYVICDVRVHDKSWQDMNVKMSPTITFCWLRGKCLSNTFQAKEMKGGLSWEIWPPVGRLTFFASPSFPFEGSHRIREHGTWVCISWAQL
jgi:hypothetical protein